jgi:hypothetical protein
MLGTARHGGGQGVIGPAQRMGTGALGGSNDRLRHCPWRTKGVAWSKPKAPQMTPSMIGGGLRLSLGGLVPQHRRGDGKSRTFQRRDLGRAPGTTALTVVKADHAPEAAVDDDRHRTQASQDRHRAGGLERRARRVLHGLLQLKLGAAKHDAGRAAGLVKLTCPKRASGSAGRFGCICARCVLC